MSFDPEEYRQQAAEEEFWDQLPSQLHEDSARGYLGVNGDAIAARVLHLMQMSSALLSGGFFGASLTVSCTTIEIMVEYFCIRPTISGAFIPELAQCLTEWVLANRRSKRYLGRILRTWDIDLTDVCLASGQQMWEMVNTLGERRDKFVHRGDEVTRDDAASGISCVEVFDRAIVGRIAERLGFTLASTMSWSRIGNLGFTTGSPF